jgi:sugar lactone lactonase YvrE
MLPHVTISNGLAWTSDLRTMYYVDSADATVSAFDFGADGSIADRRAFYVHHGEGVPDGICRDDEDHLWVAINGGGELRRFSPSGEQVATVAVAGAEQVSSCALGGPSGRILFATTAFENMPAAQRASQPHAGLVHAVEVDVAGPPMTPYSAAASGW